MRLERLRRSARLGHRLDDEHPAGTQQQAADAVYEMCAAAETASEITVRAHAALHALADGGWTTRPEALDDVSHHRWWEHRPSEYAATVARAHGRPNTTTMRRS